MPELLDVRDERGELTGEVMARSEVHRTEKWHGIALIWIYNSKGQILLQHRAAHLNVFPDKWDISVSGHLIAGETPKQAALREVVEELGLYVHEEELEVVGSLANEYPLVYGKQHREYDYIFLVKADPEIEALRLQVAEVMEARWISVDDFEHDLADPVMSKHYSQRDPQVYKLIIDKLRQLGQGSAQ